MKKENFVSLLLGTVGGILFALGMCMCLISEWDAFRPGLVMGALGIIVLIIMVIVRRRMKGLPPVCVNKHTLFVILWAAAGALILGIGMCMVMVWEGFLVWGIVVGILGILLLLSLIPICKGLK